MAKNPYLVKSYADDISLWKNKTSVVAALDMELTERCNNNCIHCYINLPAEDRTAEEKELSTQEIKGILEEAASLGCLKVRFTGGEPLLRQDFEEIYLYARKLGLRVVLLTNATLITPKLAKLFERTPALEVTKITLYGMKRSSYESVTRVSGSFEAAWRGISLLLERRVPFVVKGVVLPPNRGEMGEFESWASTIPCMDGSPSYSIFFDLRCRRDSEEKNDLIKGMRLSPEEILEFLARRKEEYVKEMREFCSRFTKPPERVSFHAVLGLVEVASMPMGTFSPVFCSGIRTPYTISRRAPLRMQ
jgi:MoaA/NifB/PqqE/SkfB family radical SAM enzyme